MTVEQAANQLAIASFNVENLAPTDPPAKFQALATQVANNLKSPDIIGVMEMQDNNGSTNDAVVSADITFNTLISAIQTAGGPAYQYRQIDPVDDQDGGQPDGNIRVGFLFNPARVSFVDRPGGSSTAAVSVIASSGGPQLSASPGRVNPTNTAFNSSRKPLAGEFIFNGRKLFLVANHFNSKGGDQPLFGRYQPPARSSEVQRKQQATVLAGFVNDIRAADANANIVVLGDINDFEFSETLGILKAAGLHDLVENLPAEERYTYVYEGNSQVLDHILVSDALAASAAPEYDVVHVNAEFAVTRSSDHEPEVVRLNLPPLLAVNVTAQVSTSISGLTYNRASQTFSGTIKVTNTGVAAISGPIQVELGGLPAGVTLVNASGSHAGAPYVTTAVASLAAGQTLSVPVRFSNPSRVSLNYSVTIYSGNF